jgi:N-acetylneuraminate lyase
MTKLTGVWPALVTPFTVDKQVNVTVLKELTEYLIQKGAGGFYICGATGQGLSMSVRERKLVLESVLDQTNGRIPVIAQVGCLAVPDAVELARHAQDAGAKAISSIIPPNYRNQESLISYFTMVAAAAPKIPFLAYILAPNVNTVAFVRALLQIPTFSGVKYTGPDMYQLRQIIGLRKNNWTVFAGMDEQSVLATMWGVDGSIGSTLNVMIGLYREIYNASRTEDYGRAQELQWQANQVTETLHAFGFMGSLRAALGFLGFDCGDPRLPALPLPAGKRQALREQLAAVNFFELTKA